MTTNIPNIHTKNHRKFIVEKSYPRNMRFFLPFIKKAGFKKEVKRIEKEFHRYTKRRIKSVVFEYISKEDLSNIKKSLC